jgi:hypothetical protein
MGYAIVLPLFCLPHARTEACWKGKRREVRNRFQQPLVNDQRPMSSRSPEGGNPFNIDSKTLRVAPEQRQFHGVKKPEPPKQQPPDPNLEAFGQMLGRPRRPIVAGEEAHIRNQRLLLEGMEQRREAEPFQPPPAEQQAERLGKPPPEGTGSKVVPEHNPQLRELTKELYGGDVYDQGVTYLLLRAVNR